MTVRDAVRPPWKSSSHAAYLSWYATEEPPKNQFTFSVPWKRFSEHVPDTLFTCAPDAERNQECPGGWRPQWVDQT